jgi:hypothetical protein
VQKQSRRRWTVVWRLACCAPLLRRVSNGLPLRRVMVRRSRGGNGGPRRVRLTERDHWQDRFLRAPSRRFTPFPLHPALAAALWVVGFGLGRRMKTRFNPSNFGLLRPRLKDLGPSSDRIRHQKGVPGAEWRCSWRTSPLRLQYPGRTPAEHTVEHDERVSDWAAH